MGNSASSASNKLPPLQTASNCVTERMMGTWFVIAVKPTAFETQNSNAVERYTWVHDDDDEHKKKKSHNQHDIDIDFTFNAKEPITSKVKSMPQKGWLDVPAPDKEDAPKSIKTQTGNWKVSPLWPIKLPYLILDVDPKHYHYCVIGYPSRAYCWIMSRTPQMNDDLYQRLTTDLKEKHQYDLNGLRKVPQKWTKSEREKRGLLQEIPDSMLEKEEELN